MSRPTPSERLAAIGTAATEVFRRLGYRGTRTADVAARAGMSAGSLFNYVESKEALFHLVFINGLGLLSEVPPVLPLRTPEPGETYALIARAFAEAPASRLRAALATSEPADVGQELCEIVEELYDLVERNWPLLAVVERCAAELPELDALWFGDTRPAIFSELTEYLERRTASGLLRAMPDATVAARVVIESVSWFAWHRREGRDASLYDDQTVRRTVIEFSCAALVPESPKEDESWTTP